MYMKISALRRFCQNKPPCPADSATGRGAGAAFLASFDVKASWGFYKQINIISTQFFALLERY